MYSFSNIVLALVSTVVAVPNALPNRTPIVYLAGDSTMAEGGGGSGTQGWGHHLRYSLSVPVVNKAVAGRSARSYTVEGRFQAIADLLVAGDFVVIEFGHNDGGSLTHNDNGRTDCPGAGSEICTSTYDKEAETVLTYPAYITNAGKLFAAKGAKVVVSSPTPNNPGRPARSCTRLAASLRILQPRQQLLAARLRLSITAGMWRISSRRSARRLWMRITLMAIRIRARLGRIRWPRHL